MCTFLYLATMPKLISYTPGWLSRPSAGFDVFTTKSSDGTSSILQTQKSAEQTPSADRRYSGPSRLIAHRGSEVFVVAADNTIRWADLAVLKHEWESEKFRRPGSRHATPNDEANDATPKYRVRTCLTQHA